MRHPVLESNIWIELNGDVIEVLSPNSFTLKTADARIVEVTVANIGEPYHPDEREALRQLIAGKRVSVLIALSALEQDHVIGDVHVTNSLNVSTQLLRTGMAAFSEAPTYALSNYSECLNKVASREAKAAGVGIWKIASK